ncbi:calpain-2 catalytic subunit-like [Echeneis naucrates]|uniref:calpain-2 catalytic subunit-like n=1 Tax=Echeneis naucrates TaxID=173247 RepID=UPI001113C530|nr:calpain-2 catalytic subunit-like [Echeneis naucrates]
MSDSVTCTSIINLRYQDGSEGSPSNPARFKYQDYAQLKDNSLRRKRLFVDNTFPPDNRSLGDLPNLSRWQEDEVEWLRPAEILKRQNNRDEPTFCMKGASRFDFSQGMVGNCWFLAAISSLTFQKHLMAQVVPMDQSFKNYAGIFHFRFWRFGRWVEVVIDDHLPTINNQLLSVRSKGGNEFWVPLLEKAYAKVCGSYADMNAGLPSEACKDFSGGVNMTYELGEAHTAGHDEKLWLQLSRATGCKSMICCGTAPKGGELVNTVAHTGLVDAHAYSVTAVTEVEYYGSKEQLVRIMNPWGKTEWNGKWSDKSDVWERVRQEDREKCFDRDDGEFWMALEDFCHYFNMVSICCENPNFIDGDLNCQWQVMIYDGSWVAGASAGGNLSYSTFATNPQYRIQVSIIDRKEQDDKNILLSLMQKPQHDNRKQRRSHPIGLTVFKVPAGTRKGRLGSSFFNRNRPLKSRQMYSYNRDVIEMHSLEPGEYVVVPSTVRPNMSAEFVLSVFTKSEVKISPHDHADDDDDDDHHDDHDDQEDEKLILPEIPTEPTEEDTDRDPTRTLFNRYADQNGQLSPTQLQRLLNDNFPHGTRYGFGLDTCRSMSAMVDTDLRMTMTFSEFSVLWKKINEFKKIFHRADLNENGTLSDYELERAIQSAGMNVSNGLVMLMMFRYSGFSTTTLENFIVLMFHLEKTTKLFEEKSTNGVIHLTWDEWSSASLYK